MVMGTRRIKDRQVPLSPPSQEGEHHHSTALQANASSEQRGKTDQFRTATRTSSRPVPSQGRNPPMPENNDPNVILRIVLSCV